MKMKTALSLVAAAVALLSHSAYAQQTRDQRKSEAASAVKAGETKAGESQPGAKPQATKSTTTRDQRKSDTAAAVKAGETPKSGEGQPTAPATKSTTTRAERKATTSERGYGVDAGHAEHQFARKSTGNKLTANLNVRAVAANDPSFRMVVNA
jgi:uncharacterized low-complexity protein